MERGQALQGLQRERRGDAGALARAALRARPVSTAEQRVLEVLAPLEPLLADGGLRRGSTAAVAGPGATALALALVAGASAAGSWVAAVGVPDLGGLAAGELGVALERVALVPSVAPERWGAAVAALVDGLDVVLLAPPPRVRAGDARRLIARARERGAVLVLAGGGATAWPEAPDVRLDVRSARWEGLGAGHGHLRGRRVEVVAEGRRGAARARRAALWLPDAEGRVRAAVVRPERREEPAPLVLAEAG